MLSDIMKDSLRRELGEQLTEARRELREQNQRLAQLRYEWGIAKRLSNDARTEDEREKWRVQSDAYLGLVLQQESSIEEIEENIDRCQSRLDGLDAQPPREGKL